MNVRTKLLPAKSQSNGRMDRNDVHSTSTKNPERSRGAVQKIERNRTLSGVEG